LGKIGISSVRNIERWIQDPRVPPFSGIQRDRRRDGTDIGAREVNRGRWRTRQGPCGKVKRRDPASNLEPCAYTGVKKRGVITGGLGVSLRPQVYIVARGGFRIRFRRVNTSTSAKRDPKRLRRNSEYLQNGRSRSVERRLAMMERRKSSGSGR